MTKINLPNLQSKKRNGYYSYFYRYKVNGITQYFSLGTSKNSTVGQVKERYKLAQAKATAVKYGLEPTFGIAPVAAAVLETVAKVCLLHEVLPKWIISSNRNQRFLDEISQFGHFVNFFGKSSDWYKDEDGYHVSAGCEIDLCQLTTDDINRFYNDQYKKGFSNSTVACRNKKLNPFYAWLKEQSYLDDNYYARKGRLSDQQETTFEYQVIEFDKIKQILDKAPNRKTEILWTIIAYTGLSPVDANRLDKTVDYVTDGTYHCIITKRKKTKVLAQVPVVGRLAKLGDAIFNLGLSKRQRTTSNKKFREAAAACGVIEKTGYKISQYSLRHSIATFLKAEGLSDNDIALFLGHNNIKQQNTYVDARTKKVQDKLVNVLN